jgi:hypothetical protein
MRRWALVLLAVLAAGCGDQATGEGGACADVLVWNDTAYFGTRMPSPRPPAGAPLEGGVHPACNDSNGEPPSHDRPTEAYRIEGVAPEIAVYGGNIVRDPYLNPGAFTALPQHPFHDNFFGSARRPVRRVRGEPCTVSGRVESLSAFYVAGRNVIIDARTRITGFDDAGMPILREGDAVRIHGSCRGDEVVGARRIEPQP